MDTEMENPLSQKVLTIFLGQTIVHIYAEIFSRQYWNQ